MEARRTRWIAPATTIGSILLIVASWLYLLNPLGLFPNHYLPIGYYGYHNRALRIVQDMPGVEVVKEWCHEDITMEDSFINLRFEGRDVRLNFYWSGYRASGLSFDDLFVGFPERLRGHSTPTAYYNSDDADITIFMLDEAERRAATP